MLVKEQPVVISPRPKSFAALMEMYEINYIQLRLLCGDLRVLPAETVSQVDRCIPVALRIVDSSRHTTTVMLTYMFQEGGNNLDRDSRPDMLIRVYHDSCQAEVISHRCRLSEDPIHYWGRELDTMLLCRWRMNRFLYKWTNYLRRQGHSFS
ncbi:MAG: DUF1249 domain-containing protein [Gammaproteobacteria bacterium]|nr:DUF1249 domain-containing protein [Gammaproteobacteria bacterium]MBU1724563.1 DUF1249 domain-containing protein [Gammaproteobacteria bacterium]MBU2004606.1 DUF1249 domain-containing protein [Gammaproteobacteria bacterium]